MNPKPPTKREIVERFITQALSYNGYTAKPNRDNIFGERLNLNGQPWDGIFIDSVAREVGLALPSHAYPPVALADYLGRSFFHARPRRGDIVFFQMSTVSDFGSPHIGIVTDASRWDTDGVIETVEGMTASGLKRQAQIPDGVYVRTRHRLDIIGFGRPRWETASVKTASVNAPTVSPAQVRIGLRHTSVTVVQLALATVTGIRGLPRGHFDERTRIAYAKFQRSIGYPASMATGEPDYPTLKRLSDVTGFFHAKQ